VRPRQTAGARNLGPHHPAQLTGIHRSLP
jgi:hypothetical protein